MQPNTRYVVFRTPTLLDLTAITTFGVNAKPNASNPIGFFGTGLKYAIACLVRAKAELELHIRNGAKHEKYMFYTKEEAFRDQSFQFIYMRKGDRTKWFQKDVRLPFTTDLGKNWELWQAFRELYSNTLDERGEAFIGGTFRVEDKESDVDAYMRDRPTVPVETIFAVNLPKFEEEYNKRKEVFLPEAYTPKEGEKIQRFNKPSKYIYYRGIRIYELTHPSLFTYNIIRYTTLTEDRTAAYPWQIDAWVAEYVTQSDDALYIEQCLKQEQKKEDQEKTFESRLNYRDVQVLPGSVFSEVALKMRQHSKDSLLPSAHKYIGLYVPAAREIIKREREVKEGQHWKGPNHHTYKVITVANWHVEESEQDMHPIMVVYHDIYEPKKVCADHYDHWRDRMILMTQSPARPEAEYAAIPMAIDTPF